MPPAPCVPRGELGLAALSSAFGSRAERSHVLGPGLGSRRIPPSDTGAEPPPALPCRPHARPPRRCLGGSVPPQPLAERAGGPGAGGQRVVCPCLVGILGWSSEVALGWQAGLAPGEQGVKPPLSVLCYPSWHQTFPSFYPDFPLLPFNPISARSIMLRTIYCPSFSSSLWVFAGHPHKLTPPPRPLRSRLNRPKSFGTGHGSEKPCRLSPLPPWHCLRPPRPSGQLAQAATQPVKVLATSAPPPQLELRCPSPPLRYSIRGCQTIHKYQQLQPHHIWEAGKIIPRRKQLSRNPSRSKGNRPDQGRLGAGSAHQCANPRSRTPLTHPPPQKQLFPL